MEEGIDPKLVQPGQALEIQNVRQTRKGELEKRKDFENLGDTLNGSSSAVYENNQELLALSAYDGRIHTYHEDSEEHILFQSDRVVFGQGQCGAVQKSQRPFFSLQEILDCLERWAPDEEDLQGIG